jgi:lysophospholipase L1-like esterase
MKLLKKIFVLVTIIYVSSVYAVTAPGDTALYKKNPNYELQTELYKIYATKQANIVMLGNSITHGVNWAELLGRTDVVDRGIPSDNTEGYLSRLDNIISLKPKVCFIMGGINDIYNWIPVEDIFKNYVKIISGLRAKKIQVVIQSTLYVASGYTSAANRNAEVEKLNKMLSDYAVKNNIIFIDLNARLSYKNMLMDYLTYDGLHLKAPAYKMWSKEVEKALQKLAI